MLNSNLSASTPHGSHWGFGSGSFDVRIVTSAAERNACFALRFRAYERYLAPSERPKNGLYCDRFDEMPTTLVIGAFDGGRLIASMRLCFSRPSEPATTMPCGAHYPALAALKTASTGALMEVSRVAIDPALTNMSYRTTLYAALVRVGIIAAEGGEVSHILIGTLPSSEKFYRYMLGFERIGEPAVYPPGDFKISLLGGDMSLVRKRQKMQNSFFRIGPDDIARMRSVLESQSLASEPLPCAVA
jgi:hypothetical protein